MPRHYKKNLGKRRPTKLSRNEVIRTSDKESDQERKNEQLQQDDADKDMLEDKQGLTEIKNHMRDDALSVKLNKLLNKLPIEDRLRKLIDEDKEEVNKNNSKSKLQLKE